MPEGVEERVHFLQRPDIWPDAPDVVRAVETHASWVFLTREYAFKLKKPVRLHRQDLRTVRARLLNARAEVELNRRLASDVYLGYLPVVRRDDGELAVGCRGDPVDWLVWMRRLPDEDMLDAALRLQTATPRRLEPAARKLARFYQGAPREDLDGRTYRQRLRAAVRMNRRALRRPEHALSLEVVTRLHDDLEAWLSAERELVESRAERLVEGHGDLRPEHVYLGSPPAFIDCLEFDRELRIVDPVDEIAFLGMASASMGGAMVGPIFLEAYEAVTADRPPPRLLAFYEALRAGTRARLAALRSLEPGEDAARAREVARRWLQLAEARLGQLGLVL